MSDDKLPKALPDASDVVAPGSPGGVKDVKSQNQDKAPSVAEALSAALGKTFSDDESALKSVKDTFSHVGRVAQYQENMKVLTEKLNTDETGVFNLMHSMIENNQPPANQPPAAAPAAPQPQPAPSTSKDGNVEAKVDKLQQDLADRDFFDANPQYKAHKPLLDKFRGNTNQPYDALVKDEVFQGALNAVQAQHEAAGDKSVLHNDNARLNQQKTKLEKASELVSTATGARQHEEAGNLAVEAVVDEILGK